MFEFSFVLFDPPDENRLIANPDVVRDARKRALVKPLLKARSGRVAEGNKVGFESQVRLLELWLVAINVLDLVKEFLVPEFRASLFLRYHDAVSAAWDDVADTSGIKDPTRLERVLTQISGSCQSRCLCKGARRSSSSTATRRIISTASSSLWTCEISESI